MAKLELAPKVADDLDRFFDHMERHEMLDAHGRIRNLLQAIEILRHSPMIGRPVGLIFRELIVGSGASGYVVLYRHVTAIDTVFVVAIRHQREGGYPTQ